MSETEIVTGIDTPRAEPLPPPHILVALDTSPHSLAALRAGAQLAAALQVELHGLFIEDDRLLRLCNSPFSREVSVLTATVRPLESLEVERKLRVMAAELRQMLAHIAAEAQVHWSFHVRRGGIEEQLLIEAQNALLLSLGRTNRFARRGLGFTARHLAGEAMRPLLLLGRQEELQGALTLVYNGSPSAQRALALAAQLTQYATRPLTVLLVATADTVAAMQAEVMQQLHDGEMPPRFLIIDNAQDIEAVFTGVTDTLILPVDYVGLLAELNNPVLLVP